MHLYLTDPSPLHSTFTTAEGQALYKVETPIKVTGRTAVIGRAIPNDVRRGGGHPAKEDMKDQYGPLAEIEFNRVASSSLRFGTSEMGANAYFRKGSWSIFGRDHIFTGPDGREYRWTLGLLISELFFNDAAKTPVAKFHRAKLGIMGKAKPAYLEVFPVGEHILDTIVITFIYVETLRKDKERAMRSPYDQPRGPFQ